MSLTNGHKTAVCICLYASLMSQMHCKPFSLFCAGFISCRTTNCWKYWLRRGTRWLSSRTCASVSMLSRNWSLELTSSKWSCPVVCCSYASFVPITLAIELLILQVTESHTFKHSSDLDLAVQQKFGKIRSLFLWCTWSCHVRFK